MTAMRGLKISGLTKRFSVNGSAISVVRGFNLEVNAGEFVVVVGPNGAGKTCLLRLISGEYLADEGRISLIGADGTLDCTQMPRWERAGFMAQVHQDPQRGTASGMTVLENLRLATVKSRIPSPFCFSSAHRNRGWYRTRLEAIGLSDKIDSRVAELSQGQRQLLAVDLAMLRRPSLLLLDEHTASLDQKNAKKCLETTVRLSRETGTTVMMATHNLMDTLHFGDRLVVMREGHLHVNLDREEKQRLDMKGLLELCGYTN